MDRKCGKAPRKPSKAGPATSRVSEPDPSGTQMEPCEPAPASRAAQPAADRSSHAGASRPRQTRGARTPQKPRPPRAPRACPAKAPRTVDGAPLPRAPSVDGPEHPAAPDLPLARAGSRRSGAARSTRDPGPAEPCSRTTPASPEEPGPGARVQVPRSRRTEAPPGGWNPRPVLDRLKLNRQQISAAAVVVNKVVDRLLRRLQDRESEFKGVTLLRTGSYYERVKISSPNEFDVMFKLEVPRIQLEEYPNSGAHYFVKFKRNPKGNPLSQFLEGEILSASKMLMKFRKIIKEEIKNMKDQNVSMEKKKPGSPAVTLLIEIPEKISVDVILALEAKTSWPANTKEGLLIHNWLGKKVRNDLRRQPFYLVPKHAKERHGFQGETWRISFSHIEKDILNNHGKSKTCCETDGVKCCRKKCLKLMKYLLEQLKKKFEDRKELNKFCSYHVKTAFFHLCSRYHLDSQWDPKDLKLCFDNCVTFLLECLRTEKLVHYFIPVVNLFSQDKIDNVSRAFLLEQIEYERNNGFPVFGEF
ncbi:cyclic GMP-AMP synthase [Dipodomys spectabilis]|uniref:cyclic GMP-AMP synthase n=1 Tax=Dipodomys spectabilis TaxID=105255 RepID=UPI001C54A1B3|nr:cyclic GMP-AMP synthase [Dipodomys spectabilis]